MKARIVWIGKNRSQQDEILKVGRYTTVARFKGGHRETWFGEAWSLDLSEFVAEDDDVMCASIKFLVSEAPIERLCIGATFDLYEGLKHTAIGEIIAQI